MGNFSQETGYIKLYRKLLDNPVFQNERLLKVFIWCLLKASYRDYEQLVGLQTVQLKPGQFIFGRLRASQELKIKPSTLNDQMQTLKKLQIIDIKPNNKFSVVTIINWELYQSSNEESDIKIDKKATTNRQQTDTNNNIKNKKNIYTTSSDVKYTPDTGEFKLAVKLRDGILSNYPKAKVPNDKGLQKWALTIDRMIRLDKRTPGEISSVIDFAMSDSFWRQNILSADALRKQFDKLAIRMESSQKVKEDRFKDIEI